MSEKPQISLIVAVARNGVIGAEGGMPWRLPSDLKRFRRLTTGHVVIMGRKTWDSIGRPLPERCNIVVTRNRNLKLEGAVLAGSLHDALEVASTCEGMERSEVFVIGGGQLYGEALAIADRIYLTRVDSEPAGDTGFPELDSAVWRVVRDDPLRLEEGDSAATQFLVYERTRQ